MTSELRECPCCSGTDLLGAEHEDAPVYCKGCGLRALSPAKWNTRQRTPDMDGVERAKVWLEMERDSHRRHGNDDEAGEIKEIIAGLDAHLSGSNATKADTDKAWPTGKAPCDNCTASHPICGDLCRHDNGYPNYAPAAYNAALVEACRDLSAESREMLIGEFTDALKGAEHHEPEVNWLAMPDVAAVYRAILAALSNEGAGHG